MFSPSISFPTNILFLIEHLHRKKANKHFKNDRKEWVSIQAMNKIREFKKKMGANDGLEEEEKETFIYDCFNLLI